MTNPRLLTIPFADTGTKNEIPVSGAIEPQLATFQAGFPVVTQQKISDGGIPPERADFNGILNIYGQHIVHLNKGMPYEFDQDFANAIGGYPLHARIMLSDGQIAQNTIDGNTSNPNLAGTGWLIGISASLVKNSNGETQQKINDYIGANWYAKAGGYALGDRVRLLTGEIVQSTVEANTNNPNVDMTGWKPNNYWKRSQLTTAIQTVNAALDAQVVNIWEFAEYVNKLGSSDPAEWDWSNATQAAINYCTAFAPTVSFVNAQAQIYYPPNTYRHYSKVSFTGGSSTYNVSPTINILGGGRSATIIESFVVNDHLFSFKNCRINMQQLTARGMVDDAKFIKVGDENDAATNGMAVYWACFDNVIFARFVESYTIGVQFDSSFRDCFFTGGLAKTNSTTNPCFIRFLPRVNDNTNTISFFRTGFENADSGWLDGGTAITADGGSLSRSHHNINFYDSHIEGAFTLLNLKRCFSWSFNNCSLVVANTTTTRIRMLILENAYNINFSGCYFHEIGAVPAYDSSLPKSIKIVGDASGIKFTRCFFSTAYRGVSDSAISNSFDTIFDVTDATYSENSYLLENCYMNDFRRVPVSSEVILARKSGSTGNQFIQKIDSDNALSFYYRASANNTSSNGTKYLTIANTGEIRTTLSIDVGYLNTTAGSRAVSFYGDGSTSWTTRLIENAGNNTTVLETKTKPIKLDAAVGAQAITVSATSLKPNINNTTTLAIAGTVFKDCFLQNAPTVVSDERHKSNIRAIDDELLDAWGTIDFKMWQLNAAIDEKGAENARWHVGLIAQQVKDALTNAGLDWTKYGLITYESWESDEEKEAGELYMLRMEECFAVESAYQRRKLDRIEATLSV